MSYSMVKVKKYEGIKTFLILFIVFVNSCEKTNDYNENKTCFYNKYEPIISLETNFNPLFIDIDEDGIDDICFYSNNASALNVWVKAETDSTELTLGNGNRSGSSVRISEAESLNATYWIWEKDMPVNGSDLWFQFPTSYIGFRKTIEGTIYYGWIGVSDNSGFKIKDVYFYKNTDLIVKAGIKNNVCDLN